MVKSLKFAKWFRGRCSGRWIEMARVRKKEGLSGHPERLEVIVLESHALVGARRHRHGY